ncbi:MAG: mechanosensitive ion channel protein MscS, partial [Cyanobacteria bacterium P01_C01_bin.147]
MTSLLDILQQTLNTPLLRVGNAAITLSAIAQFLLAVLLALAFSLVFKRVLSSLILRRLGLKPGIRESIATITSYSLGMVLCLILLQTLGINFAS